jgi:hypothetical protein
VSGVCWCVEGADVGIYIGGGEFGGTGADDCGRRRFQVRRRVKRSSGGVVMIVEEDEEQILRVRDGEGVQGGVFEWWRMRRSSECVVMVKKFVLDIECVS